MNFDDTPKKPPSAPRPAPGSTPTPRARLRRRARDAPVRPPARRERSTWPAAKAWQKKKAEAGWACLHWPKEYGGRGATPIERVIWQQEEGPYGALSGLFVIGHGMCGPTMMAFAHRGAEAYVTAAAGRGEEIWCQLFSEPAGGSDVAGLRTRAERGRRATGSSTARRSGPAARSTRDCGILITRTDPNVPKHKGLTMFFLT